MRSLRLVTVQFSYLSLADSERESHHFEEDAVSDMAGYRSSSVEAVSDDGSPLVSFNDKQKVYLHGPKQISVEQAIHEHVMARKQARLPGID